MTTIIYKYDEKKGELEIKTDGIGVDIMTGLAAIIKLMAEDTNKKASDIAKDLYEVMRRIED